VSNWRGSAAYAKWLAFLEAAQTGKQVASSDQLLGMKEIADLSTVHTSYFVAGRRRGIPSSSKDGGSLVGYADALERWIGVRVRRHSR
jgi:hypothetical protein